MSRKLAAGRALPWLQPVVGEDVWSLWSVVPREVVILGPNNERLGAFNLVVNNLSDPTNYTALMDQLLEAAGE